MRTRDRKGAARRKIVAERMRAFHNALLAQASAILPDFQKKIEQRISSNNPYGRLSSSGSDLGLLLPHSLAGPRMNWFAVSLLFVVAVACAVIVLWLTR